MRLKVKRSQVQVHSELAAAVGWNVWNELYSASDDQTIHKWNMLGEPEQKVRGMERPRAPSAGPLAAQQPPAWPLWLMRPPVRGPAGLQRPCRRREGPRHVASRGPSRLPLQVCQLDAFFTDLHWYPLSSKKTQAGGTDVFAVACTDGERSCSHGASAHQPSGEVALVS
jgi:hypothetical protein